MAVGAVWSFLQGVESAHRRAVRRLGGSPVVVRLTYLGGHPGIWHSEPFWAGKVGDRLRLVDMSGDRWYDLPADRITNMACDGQGELHVEFEPTAGLVTTVAFHMAEGSEAGCRRLTQLVLLGN